MLQDLLKVSAYLKVLEREATLECFSHILRKVHTVHIFIVSFNLSINTFASI